MDFKILKFCSLEIIVRPSISLVTKCITFLASKLEYFENDVFLPEHLLYPYLKGYQV